MSIFQHAPITWTADTVCDADAFNTEIKEKLSDIDAIFPSGIILMWAGSIATIPTGWYLCNGSNGTPDLRDRFIVGAGSTYAVAATGGEAAHTLITAEMPSHKHTTSVPNGITALGTGAYHAANDTFVATDSSSVGGDGTHENRPPYYALAYIMKS